MTNLALLERAKSRVGLSDFGEWPIEQGFRKLLASFVDEAELSLFGHLCTHWDIVRLLCNLLRLRHEVSGISACETEGAS